MARRWEKFERHLDEKKHHLGDWMRNIETGEVIYCGIRQNYNQGDSKSLIFRNTNSVCVDVDIIEAAKARDVRVIVFKVKSTKTRYATTVATLEKFGVLHSYKHKDQKPQLALPVHKFVVQDKYTLKM
jgi:hypothetical protein